MKPRYFTSFLMAIVFTTSSFAGTVLTIACGEGAYDAVSENRPEQAQVYAILNLKGPQSPPELVSLKAPNIRPLTQANSRTFYEVNESQKKITISRNQDPYDSVDFLVKNCEDIDVAEGSATIKKYVGGFAGHEWKTVKPCSCKVER